MINAVSWTKCSRVFGIWQLCHNLDATNVCKKKSRGVPSMSNTFGFDINTPPVTAQFVVTRRPKVLTGQEPLKNSNYQKKGKPTMKFLFCVEKRGLIRRKLKWLEPWHNSRTLTETQCSWYPTPSLHIPIKGTHQKFLRISPALHIPKFLEKRNSHNFWDTTFT